MNAFQYAVPKGEAFNVSHADIESMDKWMMLNPEGQMCLYPASVYADLPLTMLRAWCCARGRYQIPTRELIVWLSERIGTRRTIEIGAGCGDLGRLLQIPMTDSYQQVKEGSTVAYMALYGIQPTRPSPEVICEDAETAVRRRKPQVVVGSWITEKWLEDSDPDVGGNMFGPREDYILERCEEYILIGNEAIHGKKRLLKKPHETFHFPWLVSRAKEQAKNVIYVWRNSNPWR